MATTTHSSTDRIDAFFGTDVARFTDALADLATRIAPQESPDSPELLAELTRAIHESREACRAMGRLLRDDPLALQAAQARFREAIAPWFDQSWFMQRAKAKPRGYPGDFEMLTAIYEGVPKSLGFGGYLDRYFLKTDLARAVCARLDAIQKFLIRETLQRAERVSILNVASGPGREYAAGFSAAGRSVALKCIDTDADALEYLREHIDPESGTALDLTCFRYNALRMVSPESNIKNFGECDIIYSVGLCDYIPDRPLARILQGWRETVKPDGIVYVAFKDAPRYFPEEYQWHVDWHFYERTESDCRELFAAAGYDADAIEMFRDETGIIMNFVARGKVLRRIRRDQATGIPAPHIRNFNRDAASSSVATQDDEVAERS